MIGKVEPCRLDAVVEVIDTDGMLCPKKKSEQKNKKNKATNLYKCFIRASKNNLIYSIVCFQKKDNV